MITCDFSIVPIGTNDCGCKEAVSIAVDVIRKSGLEYELTGMGTHIEADSYNELYNVLSSAQEAIFISGVSRVYSVIKIDDRRDKNHSLKSKVCSVEDLLE